VKSDATSGYLIRHGRSASWGFCPAPQVGGLGWGDLVVVRSWRGLEIGEILAAISESQSLRHLELVRRAESSDIQRAEAHIEECQNWLQLAQRCGEELRLPVAFIDADMSLDGQAAWFHVLRWQPCDVTPLLIELRRGVPVPFDLIDLSRPLATKVGCGSCSTAGCGCQSSAKSDKGCGSSGCGCAARPSPIQGRSTASAPPPRNPTISSRRISLL